MQVKITVLYAASMMWPLVTGCTATTLPAQPIQGLPVAAMSAHSGLSVSETKQATAILAGVLAKQPSDRVSNVQLSQTAAVGVLRFSALVTTQAPGQLPFNTTVSGLINLTSGTLSNVTSLPHPTVNLQ